MIVTTYTTEQVYLVKQESKINQRRATNLKAYHTVANHLYSGLMRLIKEVDPYSSERRTPSVLYTNFVLLTMKTTKDSNIYYLVRYNHETLQKLLFVACVYERDWKERREREAKILLKIYPAELLFIKIEELHNHGMNSEGVWWYREQYRKFTPFRLAGRYNERCCHPPSVLSQKYGTYSLRNSRQMEKIPLKTHVAMPSKFYVALNSIS